ncbi:Mitotic checkpoint protein BUB3 [Astathelohania contejeani]|uniref:Mitotic checkpoint protein BUB3 n=1 Tax=Astathelohania contejeani TaxID=164912 RepID=A0ABQ7HVE0_9MICR|nr:Mitotic checkpoint protein BUB3 [Thelohania contejeani]
MGISDIKYNNFLLVSGWDCSVRLYNNGINNKVEFDNPILKSTFTPGGQFYSGDVEGVLYQVDMVYPKIIGSVVTPCGGIQALFTYRNAILMGGWNNFIVIVEDNKVVSSYPQKGKILCGDICEDKLIVGLTGGEIIIFDLRTMKPIYTHKHINSIRSIRYSHGVYYVGFINGRIHKEDLTNTLASCTFHAHVDDNSVHYPVNSLEIKENILMSGGSDGRVLKWDASKNKVIGELYKCPNSVGWINSYNNNIAIGYSNLYEKKEFIIKEEGIKIIRS